MVRPSVPARSARVLITDLDNTLYDWFSVWYESFSAMMAEIQRISGLSLDDLGPEIRKIHQSRGTSEYSYLIQEMPSLAARHGDADLREVYETAIQAYRTARSAHLVLYPGVAETLMTVKRSGAVIAAYTDSLGFYSAYRLRELKLDGVIDVLYSPNDHDFPDGITASQLRTRDEDSYDLQDTKHHFTPAGATKPNAKVLRTILSDLQIEASEAAYVGDSLMKDIVMAQDVGLIDVYAEYGQVESDDSRYELLRSVSHWTQEDVEREREINSHREVKPTIVLKRGFAELIQNVTFHE